MLWSSPPTWARRRCRPGRRRDHEHFGRIDILFNNAGINIRKQPEDLSLDEWQEVIDTNLTSAFLMSKAVYPAMKKAGGGKIVNIGSMTSIFGSPFASAYAATKGGIVQLTKSLALAWAKDNIQVNAILPGWFDTELTEKAREQIPGLHERVLARIPPAAGPSRPTWPGPPSGSPARPATMSPASRSPSTADNGVALTHCPHSSLRYTGVRNDPAEDLDFEPLAERKLDRERLDRHQELEASRRARAGTSSARTWSAALGR